MIDWKRSRAVWLVPLAGLLLSSGMAAAQDKGLKYPTRPIRILIGVAPGAGADMVARATAQILTDRWGQNAVVDPRPGGGGVIASETLLRSTPDGYTILQSGDGLLFQTATKRVPFDVLKEFEPIVASTQQPYILVAHPAVPANTVKELVALSAAKPLTYAGSSGLGGTVHLGMERFAKLSGMRLRVVAYKGSAPALMAAMGGEIQLVCASVMSATTAIRSGKLKGIAAMGTKRATSLPDLPTAIEQGLPPGFRITNRYNLWVRVGTPKSIIESINRVVLEGINAPAVVQRLATDGSEPADRMTPAELRTDLERINREINQQVKELGLKF